MNGIFHDDNIIQFPMILKLFTHDVWSYFILTIDQMTMCNVQGVIVKVIHREPWSMIHPSALQSFSLCSYIVLFSWLTTSLFRFSLITLIGLISSSRQQFSVIKSSKQQGDTVKGHLMNIVDRDQTQPYKEDEYWTSIHQVARNVTQMKDHVALCLLDVHMDKCIQPCSPSQHSVLFVVYLIKTDKIYIDKLKTDIQCKSHSVDGVS